MLRKLGIVVGKDTKGKEVFNELFPDFMLIDYSQPSEYVELLWMKYKSTYGSNRSLNGKIFEYILATLCLRENLLPFHLNTKVAFVPNVNYDLMFYCSDRGPICWSIKTSLRERYKQADLESMALKQVHRRALSYLITLDVKEAADVKNKISTGEVVGLNDVIIATSSEFDSLILFLKSLDFCNPPTIDVFKTSQIITRENLERIEKGN